MSEHAELSPSAAERWLNCTASVAFTRGVIENESEYAKEGTIAHEALELWNTLGVPPQDGETYYNLLPLHERVLDLERRGYTTAFEVRAKYSEQIWGTIDVRAVKGKKLKIIDEKYGYVAVGVKANPQLLTYVMCSEAQLETKFSSIEIEIHQPRAPHIDGPLRTFDVSRELMDWFELEVHTAVNNIESGNVKFMPGKWCRYCNMLGNCRTGTNYFAKLITGRPLL